jgi:hypothetical protein
MWPVLLTKYYSGDIIKNNEMGVACSAQRKMGAAYRVLMGKREGALTTWKT